MDIQANMSSINCLSHNDSDPAQKSPAGLSTALASVLILTIVVDIVGNVLVILSVFRNKKLRNAGQLESFLLCLLNHIHHGTVCGFAIGSTDFMLGLRLCCHQLSHRLKTRVSDA